jgi:Glycosyltransferase family 87
VIAQLMAPLTLLPFWVFYALSVTVSVLCLVWLVGPVWAVAALALPPVAQELAQGNIHFPLAVLLIVGLTQRRLWWAAFPLTKVLPGAVLFFDAFRGDWRSLRTSVGVAGLLALISFIAAPDLWWAWLRLLLATDTSHVRVGFVWLALPLWAHIGLAFGLTWTAARTGWLWLLAPALLLAMPIGWMNSLVVLLAIPRLTRVRLSEPANAFASESARTRAGRRSSSTGSGTGWLPGSRAPGGHAT